MPSAGRCEMVTCKLRGNRHTCRPTTAISACFEKNRLHKSISRWRVEKCGGHTPADPQEYRGKDAGHGKGMEQCLVSAEAGRVMCVIAARPN